MKRKLLGLLLGISLIASLSVPAMADTLYGASDWNVTFTEGSKMETSFTTAELTEAAYNMQPGDTVIMTLALNNENASSTDWYMSNEVTQSLEDSSEASGGAYTYILTYSDGTETTTIFSSETVGGESTEGGEGLHAAAGALEDYIYLDTLAVGASGAVTLQVGLDGETQGNDYANTRASLKMDFAVELTNPGTTTTGTGDSGRGTGTIVKTGDDSNLNAFVIVGTVSGVLFLLLCFYGKKLQEEEKRRKEMGAE